MSGTDVYNKHIEFVTDSGCNERIALIVARYVHESKWTIEDGVIIMNESLRRMILDIERPKWSMDVITLLFRYTSYLCSYLKYQPIKDSPVDFEDIKIEYDWLTIMISSM